MQLTAERLPRTTEQLDRTARVYTDTATWAAEMLNGSMRTSFEYRFNGVDLYGEDGGSVTAVFDDAIAAAEVIVRQKPNLLFELRRRLIEREELEDMLAMARGDLPNTMIVVSDYPPELMDATDDVGGYNAARKQTMLRVIARQPDGSLRMTTQSLDGSNRQALEALYGCMGEVAQPGELLGQRIYRDLPEAWQEQVADDLAAVYDAGLQAQFGGTWSAGIRQAGSQTPLDTYAFAVRQTDLIAWFSEAKLRDPLGAEALRFKFAAAMSERFEKHRAGYEADRLAAGGTAAPQSYFPDQMLREIESAMSRAIAGGRAFSGCGATARAEGFATTEEQLREGAGYGNKSNESTSYKFDRHMYCVDCQKPPKKGDAKKMCGPCGLCRACDKKHGGAG